MIIQLVYLKDYDWLIKIYYAVDTYYREEILDELESIDCSKQVLDNAAELMYDDSYNTGFTYTNHDMHVTIMVIGLTEDNTEFANTLDHEKGHATAHIAETLSISPYSEEYLYLAGEISRLLHKEAKRFLCEECRLLIKINLINHGKIKIKLR